MPSGQAPLLGGVPVLEQKVPLVAVRKVPLGHDPPKLALLVLLTELKDQQLTTPVEVLVYLT